jgi:hypothetical protein
MYNLLIEHRIDGATVEGNYKLLERVLSAATPSEPVAVGLSTN